jgi:hypothetical protein
MRSSQRGLRSSYFKLRPLARSPGGTRAAAAAWAAAEFEPDEAGAAAADEPDEAGAAAADEPDEAADDADDGGDAAGAEAADADDAGESCNSMKLV